MKNRTKAIVAVLVALVAVVSGYLVILTLPSSSSGMFSSATCAVPLVPYSKAAASGNPTVGNWTTSRGDNSRSGVVPMAPITSVRSEWAAPTGLDGQVYAQPLVCGDSVFVVTENDSVYAVNATTGVVEWRTHLGTPVQGSTLPCGDINPSGITGTPVIDVAMRTLYVVAFLSGGVADVIFSSAST